MDNRLRSIPGHKGYFAAADGTIHSAWKRRGPIAEIGNDPRPLKTIMGGDGRPQVQLQRKTYRICRLMLEAFVGPCPDGMEACHFPDRDPSNNRIENLRWDTKVANQSDRIFHKTTNDGIANGSVKLDEASVIEIRDRFESGEHYKSIASDFGIYPTYVHVIARRGKWKTVS